MVPRFPLLLALALFPLAALASIRVSPERELTPRQVDLAAFDQKNAHIATDGVSFFTIWEDNFDILGARLDASGALIDQTPVAVDATSNPVVLPEIAWGTDRYLAVWQTGSGVRGRFIERDGAMQEPFDIAGRTGYAGRMHIAFNGSVFLVMWLDATFRGAIVDPSGRVLATTEITRDFTTSETDLVAMGGTFYFAYGVYRSDGMHVTALPIEASGEVGSKIEVAPPLRFGEKIHAAARANDLLIAWSADQAIHSVRLTRDAVGAVETIPVGFMWLENIVVDGFDYLLVYGDNAQKFARRAGAPATTPLPVSAPPESLLLDAATSGTRIATIMRRYSPFDATGGDLYTTVFGENAIAPLATGPRHQELPAIAAAGATKLVVWREHETSERKVALRALRLDASGAPLDAQPIELGASTSRSAPQVASNGTGWLVVWGSNNIVHAVRVSHDGTVIDAAPLPLGNQLIGDIGVVWDGRSYVVAFGAGVHTTYAMTVVRVPASGSPELPFGVHAPAPSGSPAIAAGPNGTLIVWYYINHIQGVLLSRTDVITPLALATDYGYPSSVAWNSDAFLLVASYRGTLHWLRIDAFGNASQSPASIDAPGAVTPRVTAFGDAFLLLWIDSDLRAAIINRDGRVAAAPAVIGPAGVTFAAADAQLVTSHPIGHPSHFASRLFVQTIEWTMLKRRAAR